MDPSIRKLLSEVCTPSHKGKGNIISFYGPKQIWHLEPHLWESFWEQYCTIVDNADPNDNICVGEVVDEYMPWVSRFRFNFQLEEEDILDTFSPFGDDFLREMIFVHQNVLRGHFTINEEEPIELLAILSKTPFWEIEEDDKRIACVEVTIQFPYTRIRTELLNTVIRNCLISTLMKEALVGFMHAEPCGSWKDNHIPYTEGSFVPLYGSSTSPDIPKSEIVDFYSLLMPSNVLRPESLDDIFIPENHIHNQLTGGNTKLFSRDDSKRIFQPMFLSLNYHSTLTTRKVIRQRKVYKPEEHEDGDIFVNSEMSETDIARIMMQNISPERFINISSWTDIGKALWTTYTGSSEGQDLWIQYTKSAVGESSPPDFLLQYGDIDSTCSSLYPTFAENCYTHRTLAWFAKIDTPKAYATWHRNWCRASMDKALSMCDADIAEALYRVYWLEFVYTQSKTASGTWYKFSKEKWRDTPGGIALRVLISTNFVSKYENLRTNLSKEIENTSDSNVKNRHEATISRITSLIKHLKTSSRKTSYMKECREKFYSQDFEGYLDSNPCLTGVVNGVIEVNGNTCYFRSAKPEDYISMGTAVSYNDNYTWESSRVKDVYEWIRKVFIDSDMIHHFFKFCASFLYARNVSKIFPIFTGNGDNSKSMVVKLISSTLGSLCIKIPTSALTEKRSGSGSANPALARVKNRRAVIGQETEEEENMKKGFIKEMTGGDSFFQRGLYSEGGDIVSTFTLFLQCNKIPSFHNADRAITKRTSIFPFDSTWVADPPADPEEQFRTRTFGIDPQFEKKIPGMAPALLWIMVQYYPHFVNEGLKEPQSVIERTKKYWRENDIYAEFTQDCIRPVLDANGQPSPYDKVSLHEVYTAFRKWYRDTYPSARMLDRSIVRSNLVASWGNLRQNFWFGIKIVDPDDDLDINGVEPVKLEKADSITVSSIQKQNTSSASHQFNMPSVQQSERPLSVTGSPKFAPAQASFNPSSTPVFKPTMTTTVQHPVFKPTADPKDASLRASTPSQYVNLTQQPVYKTPQFTSASGIVSSPVFKTPQHSERTSSVTKTPTFRPKSINSGAYMTPASPSLTGTSPRFGK